MPAAGTHFATAWSVHFTLVGPFHSESLRRLAGWTSDAKHACSDLEERDSGRLQIGGAFASSFSLNRLSYSITVDSSALRLFMFASSIASKIMIGK